MSYPAIALIGIALAAIGALIALAWRRTHRGTALPPRTLLAILITVVVLITLTAVFDNVMIGLDLFHYAASGLSGWSVGLAPIEDFSYPIAGAILLPTLWLCLARGGSERRRNFAQFVLSSRPVSWVNTAFPFGAAYLLTTREIDWIWLVGVLYFLVPYNLAMYGINDVFDYASDLRNPRKGGIEGALLAPRLHRPMLLTAAITNIPLLIILGFAGGPAAWIALLVSGFAVVAYSAPGLRFKERPFLDSVTSSTHFVSPAVVALTVAGAEFTGSLVLVLIAFFLWGMAAHAFGAVQDVIPDREAGIHSIATAVGARTTTRIALALWVLAGVAVLFSDWPGPLAALLSVPYIVNCVRWWNVTDESSGRTNAAWRRFIWLNYFSGFLATLILILEWTHS
ncbi:MAG: prenyltransferase [Leucobacter sp.]